ncbi:MAG: indolepyruvate ferredoxin oxidoreductase subunit alpha [Clostridia bacterium]|nr:indolepyruvate ferredoxin oxidoreductase subunit alpha [Clostridia bacterium]
MKQLMLGNEAIARGAWEAGVRLVSSYPGTPSTEITEFCSKYPDMYVEWASNEKVALEVGVGASLGGARALCCMKHVGLNVAADPLYTASYTGVGSGLVVVVADDPGMHSSQNEQDSRNHARGALLPMLEPADSAECREFIKIAYELSEKYDTPVLIRTTTRIAHARSLTETAERAEVELKEYQKNIQKNVMMPAMAKGRHVIVEKRMNDLAEEANSLSVNRMEMRDAKIGVICSGTAYQYVREAAPEASTLKLGLVNPLPEKLIREFAASVEKLYVMEELEPIVEEQVRAMGIECEGKNLTGRQGELSLRKVAAILADPLPEPLVSAEIPNRPPVMCPGCPHRASYYVIRKLGLTAMGDIGCYTLGALPPTSAIDACLCMGASIGLTQGFTRMRGEEAAKKTIAVIGDSTFMHSGINSLLSAVYNQSDATIMILDNTTTGMTGHQPNPATGFDIHGNPAGHISLEKLCEAAGANVRVVDAYDLKGLEAALKEETARKGVSVIISRKPCALLDKKSKKPALHIEQDACKKCMACTKIGCPAIEKTENGVRINPALCVGCELCTQMCKFGAIRKAGE